ncbi:hypothetical protein P3S67_020782 [Capsicum chacoense]
MAIHENSLDSPSSNPLFSTIITLYTVILLYFPATIFRSILFSPVFLSTSILVLSLLRLGATQKTDKLKRDSDWKDCISAQISPPSQTPRDIINDVGPTTPNPDTFYFQWNVGVPLEVIQEEYEDEGEIMVVEKYGSLSLYYKDMDTDMNTCMDTDSSGGDLLENLCFEWEEEDTEGLIEIELDGKRNSEVEEENLIEIDLTPAYFPAR